MAIYHYYIKWTVYIYEWIWQLLPAFLGDTDSDVNEYIRKNMRYLPSRRP